MSIDVNEIKKSLSAISKDVTLLDMLIEFERIVDECDMYAYENWNFGELVSGPEISKYWFTTTWMYPKKKMPDPKGGLRLLKYGCKISYAESSFKKLEKHKFSEKDKHGIELTSQYDKPVYKEVPVWLVKIEMPRKFIDDGIEEFIDIDQYNFITIDDDIKEVYEDDDVDQA